MKKRRTELTLMAGGLTFKIIGADKRTCLPYMNIYRGNGELAAVPSDKEWQTVRDMIDYVLPPKRKPRAEGGRGKK